MNRRKLPGVASATKRLADGTLRRYYYAWRGGPLLRAEDGRPLQPGDPAFHVAYTAAHAARRKPALGTLFSLIAASKASSEFTGIKSEKTKKDYRRHLKMIEDEFGTMPVAALEDKRAATPWPIGPAPPIMRGRCWRAFCPSPKTAVQLPSMCVSAAGVSMTPIGPRSFGPRTASRGSARSPPTNCNSRCCSPCGPGSGRAI